MSTLLTDCEYLALAYQEALKSLRKKEVPVGAVIVRNNFVIAKAHNLKETKKDVTAHAEILAIKKAQKKLNDWRLTDCVLYSTLEPCPMCAGAIIHARINKIIFGAKDLKWGAAGSVFNLFQEDFNHKVAISYLEDSACAQILIDFFKGLR
ncbi:MAG: nucleoside deaminase [Candidatus Margulisiibacteriota bacterium]|jgi:tRNA(adenine34) deaminase